MIIKQSVVDVLMFLFERYLDDEELSETSRVTDERDSIQIRLEEMGFHNQEINQAFDWLEDLADLSADFQDDDKFTPVQETSTRIYSEEEKKLINMESIGFLNFLEQTKILIPATRELVLDRVIALGQPLDAEQLKWIIMIVLHTQPGEENALALMEDFIFEVIVPTEEEIELARWKLSGPLNIDCMFCHHSDGAYSPEAWWEQIRNENFAWAPTAALGLGEGPGAAGVAAVLAHQPLHALAILEDG